MKPTHDQKDKWDVWAAKDGAAWDQKKLGATAAYIRRAPLDIESDINKSVRQKKLISIRLPTALIESLKTLAEGDEMGYQTYIRQVLAHHVRANFSSR